MPDLEPIVAAATAAFPNAEWRYQEPRAPSPGWCASGPAALCDLPDGAWAYAEVSASGSGRCTCGLWTPGHRWDRTADSPEEALAALRGALSVYLDRHREDSPRVRAVRALVGTPPAAGSPS